MSSKPLIPVPTTPTMAGPPWKGQFSDFWALTKPEVNFLILITTVSGFYLGSASARHSLSFLVLLHTLVGTLLVASGTATLNQYMERTFDAQMRRTARRPAAAGRLSPNTVLGFGIALSVAGTIDLAVTAGILATLLAQFTLLSYLLLYTPLKRKTPLCVLVGAFPGAMPALIGWAAASGRLSMQAWLLYAIVFLWQFPHFMAIAWMYREDYDRAGYRILPTTQGRILFLALQTVLPLAALVPIAIAQLSSQHAPLVACLGLVLTLAFVFFGLQFVVRRSRGSARQLLAASIVYLPLVLVLSIAAR
jgi:heme o synthase